MSGPESSIGEIYRNSRSVLSSIFKSPGFITRYRNKKIHLRALEDIEGVIDANQDKAKDVINEELRYHVKRKKLEKKTEEKVSAEQYLRLEVQTSLAESKDQLKILEIEDYKRRLALQVQEQQMRREKIAQETEEKEEAEAQELRLWRSTHWKQQSVLRREEAAALRSAMRKREESEAAESMQRAHSDWLRRDLENAKQQVLPNEFEVTCNQSSGFGRPPSSSVRHPETAPFLSVFINSEDSELNPPLQLKAENAWMEKDNRVDVDESLFGSSNDVFNASEFISDGGRAGSVSELPGADTITGWDRRDNLFDVHPFSSGTQTEYEVRNAFVQDAEADIGRMQNMYDALLVEIKLNAEAIIHMNTSKKIVDRDISQVQNELAVVQREQTSPYKRLPTAIEIETTHFRKERLNSLKAQAESFDHVMSIAQEKKKAAEKQSVSLAKDIAIVKERQAALDRDVKAVNGGQGRLPIVVGRNLSKIGGMELVGEPRVLMNAVTQKSKLVMYTAMKDRAISALKEASALEQKIWIAHKEGVGDKIESELVLSRLADIAGRLENANLDTLKRTVIDSLRAFQAKKVPLRSTRTSFRGFLPWFRYYNKRLSSPMRHFEINKYAGVQVFDPPGAEQVDPSFQDGVRLSLGKTGHCVGMIKLPKFAVWRVKLQVCAVAAPPAQRDNACARRASAYSSKASKGGATGDCVTIRLGSSLSTITRVALVNNKPNPQSGEVLYDVFYLFRSDVLVFRFEFHHESDDVDTHLAVGVGMYEEGVMAPFELYADPKDKNRDVMLSSVVKIMRLEERTGKKREENLLEELVGVEEAKPRPKYWDSKNIANVAYRYKTEFFVRILKAEILLENSKKIAALTEEKRVKDDDHIKRLAVSEQGYYGRKRSAQLVLVSDAGALVGRRLDIWDPHSKRWRHCIAQGCNVNWVDNGVIAKITHTLVEIDETNGKLSSPFPVDLSLLRFVASEVDKLTESPIMLTKERIWTADRLVEFDRYFDGRLKAVVDATEEYKEQQTKRIRGLRKALAGRVQRQKAEELARRLEDSKIALAQKGKFQAGVASIGMRFNALGMKIGDFLFDDTHEEDENDLTLDEWRVVDEQVDREAALIESQIAQQETDALAVLETLKKEGAIERRKLEVKIIEAKREERRRFKGLVSFEPEEFKKAKYKPTACEHTRAKSWGDKYGTGVRCLDCGKELGQLHNEESQVLGYGTGISDWMVDALNKHRKNDASVRFADPAEAALVTAERIRLEKERYEMSLEETQFNDFRDLKRIYKFDQRHAADLKQRGVFRQGMRWSEEELETFRTKKISEKLRQIKEEGELESRIENYEPLDIVEDPAPTFRAVDMYRRTQFHEILFHLSRINNFQTKIRSLKQERLDLQKQQVQLIADLDSSHRHSFQLSYNLEAIERDFVKTNLLIETYDKAQKMCSKATEVHGRALRAKRKADMRACGLWDDVKELTEQLAFVHNETREMLKTKYMLEGKLDTLEMAFNVYEENVKKLRLGWLDAEKASASLRYRQPGSPVFTKYGYGYIRVYRARDDMLMITLPFGDPPAKLWMSGKEIEYLEQSKQRAERINMEMEDDAAHKRFKLERIAAKKERFLMEQEEINGLKRIYKLEDLHREEQRDLDEAVDHAVSESYESSASRKFRAIASKIADARLKTYMEHLKTLMRKPGKRGEVPKKLPSTWKLFNKRNMMLEEIRKAYVEKIANRADATVREKYEAARVRLVEADIIHQFSMEIVNSSIHDIAAESLREGHDAKISAEKLSGILFASPSYMQYDMYKSLCNIWKVRKEELKENIDANKGLAAQIQSRKYKAPLDPEVALELERQRRLRRETRQRVKEACVGMAREEQLTRTFVAWQLRETLRERRAMREEDMEASRIRRELKRIEAAMKSAYAVNTASAAEAARAAATTEFELRRQELKRITLERRMREEDQAFMTLEDKMSEDLRSLDKQERMRKAYLKEFGEKGKESNVEVQDNFFPDDTEITLPEWLPEPECWLEWGYKQRLEYVNFMSDMRLRRKRISTAIELENRYMEKATTKSYREWAEGFSVFDQRALEAEYDMMIAEEQAKEAEANLLDLENNIRKINIFCREKGNEELAVKTKLHKREELARRRDLEVKEAEEWLRLCIEYSRRKESLRRRIQRDCQWIDTDAINGFYQRFRTVYLCMRLHSEFFIATVYWIVNCAEILATERALLSTQNQLSINKGKMDDRIFHLNRLRRAYTRKERMRTRRSALNKTLFPGNRKAVLSDKFEAWVRYLYFNRGQKEAFRLKYEVLKRGLDIERQFKLLSVQKEKEKLEPVKSDSMVTTMQRHREHLKQCKTCHQFYLEAQNTSFSCSFHSEPFALHCPKTCPSPGLTNLCQAHRIRRWRCCESTNYDCPGCTRRYHIPPESDPIYDRILTKITERDQQENIRLDEQLPSLMQSTSDR